MRTILWLLPVVALAGCHDWDKDLAACKAAGRCPSSGGNNDAGGPLLQWSASPGQPLESFGEVAVKGQGVLKFKLTNAGTVKVNNLKVSLAGVEADFHVVDASDCARAEFAVADFCEVTVTFTPQAVGVKTDTLRAVADQGTWTQVLTGRGATSKYSVAVYLDRAQPVVITYEDSRFGTIVRVCEQPTSCVFALSGPATVTADIGDEGLARLASWGGGCTGTTGSTCTKDVKDTQETLTVDVKFKDAVKISFIPNDGSGEVTFGATRCTQDCTVYALGAATLSARGLGDSIFEGWSESGCTAASASCAIPVPMTGAAVNARFIPRSRVFVTSSLANPSSAMAGGFKAFDGFCAEHARDAGITTADGGPTAWKAWVADGFIKSPKDNLDGRGWVRVDGRPFFDLDPAKTLYPPVLDERGRDLRDGGTLFVYGSDYNRDGGCNAAGTWRPGEPASHWPLWDVGQLAKDCTTFVHVLCFQSSNGVAQALEPVTRPTGAGLAFVSSGLLNGSAGISAFNALCSSEADGGNFVARVEGQKPVHPGGWARADGVTLFEDDSLTTYPLAAIAFQADAGLAGLSTVWAGTSANNCGGWTDGGASASAGSPLRANDGWNSELLSVPCGETARLYCFEN